MSETVLKALDAEGATKLLRHLGPQEALEAGILTPMAGTRPVRLFSLEEAESFLVVHAGAVDFAGTWAKVNYVVPEQLAAWVGDTLGDSDLAAALQEIVATRKAYGFLVPEMKSLIAARIEQAKQVSALAEAPVG